MDKKIAILKYFFDDPTGEFHIRELARRTKLNHMTVRKYLHTFVKEALVVRKESKLYQTYAANTGSKKLTNIKLYYNLEQIRESAILNDLELAFDYPIIILFGSYGSATNTRESDVDLFVLTNIQKEFAVEKYEKILKRKISLHKFTEKEFQNLKIKNPELVNNICNGITLSGRLEII